MSAKGTLQKPRTNLVGKTFGAWTVLARGSVYVAPNGHRRGRWLCRCKCGKEKEVLGGHLTSGQSRSCEDCGHDSKRKSIDVERAVILHRYGRKWHKVARRLGVHQATLRSKVRRAGLPTGTVPWVARIGVFERLDRMRMDGVTWDVVYRSEPNASKHYTDWVTLSRAYWLEVGRREVARIDRILTSRVWRTHELTELGWSAQDIARELGVTTRSVARYRRQARPHVEIPDLKQIQQLEAHNVNWHSIWFCSGKIYRNGVVLRAVCDYFTSRWVDRQDQDRRDHAGGD